MIRTSRLGFARIETGRALEAIFETLLLWHERAQQRRQLAELDDRFLKDIGVSRGDAANEARKPFWRS